MLFIHVTFSCLDHLFLTATDTSNGTEKKHAPRNFSLDVHPFMSTIQKPKPEVITPQPPTADHSLDSVFIEGVVHVSSVVNGNPAPPMRV